MKLGPSVTNVSCHFTSETAPAPRCSRLQRLHLPRLPRNVLHRQSQQRHDEKLLSSLPGITIFDVLRFVFFVLLFFGGWKFLLVKKNIVPPFGFSRNNIGVSKLLQQDIFLGLLELRSSWENHQLVTSINSGSPVENAQISYPKYSLVTSWWFHPTWKILVNLDHIPN